MRALIIAFALLATPLHAECTGRNILATMAPAALAPIAAAANAVPYPSGNLWTATRDGAHLTIVGTYHLDDPRHAATLRALAPRIDAATTVLVEAGPEEEAALKARMASDPSVLLLQDTTLRELLTPQEWEILSEAMTQRGVPAFMASRFQPWYISVMLAIPPCKMATLAGAKGLDALIIDRATTAAIPVLALEPFDTILTLFGNFTLDDQLGMIRSSLAMEARADDYFVTMADLYFAGQSRMMWELMRAEAASTPGYSTEQIETDFATLQEALMYARNRTWIPVIENAARTGPALIAFGALHLPGDDGVLALLARNGWTITPLDLTP